MSASTMAASAAASKPARQARGIAWGTVPRYVLLLFSLLFVLIPAHRSRTGRGGCAPARRRPPGPAGPN